MNATVATATLKGCKLTSVINMKGGVGKTTLSVNLGMELAADGKKVLLVDLDPQSNATLVCMSELERIAHAKNGQKTITSLFIDAFEPRVPVNIKSAAKVLDIARFVHTVNLDLSRIEGGLLHFIPADIYLSSVLRGINLGPYTLDRLITDDVKGAYDYIIIDCAPTYSSLTTIALNTTRSVLIPMISDDFGKHGTDLMKQILDEHKHDYGVDIAVIGVVFTMRIPNSATQSATEREIVVKWGSDNVFKTSITRNEWYRISNGKRQPLAKSGAHTDVKDELREFVGEFVKRSIK